MEAKSASMLVAASDYDGTLCRDRRVAASDLQAIDDWRAAGHLFGIVTGRDLGMIDAEITKWRIPCDFLVCCCGATMYDDNFRELRRIDMDDALIPKLLSHPLAAASFHFELSRHGQTFLHIQNAASRFPQLGVPFTPLTRAEAMALTGLQLISFTFADAAECKTFTDMVMMEFSGRLRSHQNGVNVDVTDWTADKGEGLVALCALRGWPAPLVIGDSENDLPMLARFGGFTVETAPEAVRARARAVYADVGTMLRRWLR
ncbi:MAG: Cof-type HAD-IIB family hydrolase [Desulfobulbaceae bacterium]|jgi:hydroxymethylpyrimidine pyrophosphatase-like HAD family hydrolase|nr:Cof-type HAD-IIB family hydrolase [Desulfobulbaceae bacterium]